jgi:beta-glucosidase
VTLIRIAAPYEPRTEGFARFHRAGRLAFTDDELRDLLAHLDRPAVLAIELDRPAVIPELLAAAGTVLSFCGAADSALLDVVFGAAEPNGRLPFDLPRSEQVVAAHHPDQPGGTPDPVLPYGWGLALREPRTRA